MSVTVFGTVLAASVFTYLFAGAHPVPAKDPQDMQNAAHQSHIIEIRNMKFQNARLDVHLGDKVTWINKDIVPHTATAIDKSWDSGRLKKGESFTLVVTKDIYLDYFCLYHRNMKAELVRLSGQEGG
jgi:plastocyanin